MSKEPILKQHNAITEARYQMSALEKNIVYLLISMLDENDSPDKEYVISTDLLESKSVKVTYESLDKATKNLITRIYNIIEKSGDVLEVKLITYAFFSANEKKLVLKISRRIMPYLVALKNNYTEFELDIALK